MHVIEDSVDVAYLESLARRLFSERRMTGDEMRDAGNRLRVLLDRLVPGGECPVPAVCDRVISGWGKYARTCQRQPGHPGECSDA